MSGISPDHAKVPVPSKGPRFRCTLNVDVRKHSVTFGGVLCYSTISGLCVFLHPTLVSLNGHATSVNIKGISRHHLAPIIQCSFPRTNSIDRTSTPLNKATIGACDFRSIPDEPCRRNSRPHRMQCRESEIQLWLFSGEGGQERQPINVDALGFCYSITCVYMLLVLLICGKKRMKPIEWELNLSWCDADIEHICSSNISSSVSSLSHTNLKYVAVPVSFKWAPNLHNPCYI